MEIKKEPYLDKVEFVSLLGMMATAIENKKKNKQVIKDIDAYLKKLIIKSNLDKEQLITKWIQVNKKEHFERLQVKTIKDYFSTLPLVLTSSIEYINKFNDYLYLIAQLSILTDWYLYKKINLDME